MVDFSKISCETTPFLVYIWPDETYTAQEHLLEYTHMSDDYVVIDLNDYKAMQNFYDQKLLKQILNDLYGDC